MDAEAIRDLFVEFGPVDIRRMFGGKGIYHRGVIIAIELRDEMMLKGDEELAAELEAAGCRRWIYAHRQSGRPVPMPYWTVPEEALDDPEEMARWARKSYEAGLRSGKEAAKPRKRRIKPSR